MKLLTKDRRKLHYRLKYGMGSIKFKLEFSYHWKIQGRTKNILKWGCDDKR